MAACVADKIIAAPFSFIGSIGVVSYVPNLQRVLDKHEIDVFIFTSGQWKRTVDVVGPVTEEGKAKLKEELDAIYVAFKNHVKMNRPKISDIDAVATGEAWLAQDAIKRNLIDEIGTSDELLFELTLTCDVFKVVRYEKDKSLLSELTDLDVGIFQNPISQSVGNRSICTRITDYAIEKTWNLFYNQQFGPSKLLQFRSKVHIV